MRSETKRPGPVSAGTGSGSDQKTASLPDSKPTQFTAPGERQARGLLHQLEVAEARVAAAPDWQTARAARRATNLLRRRLRPAPVDGGAAALEAIRASQVNAIVSWAESQSGGGR